MALPTYPASRSHPLQQAADLLRAGARRVLVQRLTGCSRHTLRALARALAVTASGGPLPSLEACLVPRRRNLQAALFAGVWQRWPLPLSSGGLLRAWSLYGRLAPAGRSRLDINRAGLIAQALTTGQAWWSRCGQCGTPVLLAATPRPLYCGGCGACQPIRSAVRGRPLPPVAPVVASGSLRADYRQLDLALDLVQAGARLALVQLATGWAAATVRDLYRWLGVAPRQGPWRVGSESLLRRQHLHAALFAGLYRRQRDAPAGVDYPALQRAWSLYARLAPAGQLRLTINQCWILARDLGAGLVSLQACRTCGTPTLVPAAELPRCPVCRATPAKGQKPPVLRTGGAAPDVAH